MAKTIADLANRYLSRNPESLSEIEKSVLDSAIRRTSLTRDMSHGGSDKLGARLADGIARVGGSWTFIVTFLVFLFVWTIGNQWILGRDSFDPYPYIFLNLVLSMLAALQAPIIMMSQNRQAERDRADAAHDYEVNLKAEIEIMALHEKLDELRRREIAELKAEIIDLKAQLTRARPATRKATDK
ncbi:MAG: DUF1003 domain-containing protein [Mesorhizobium sp.]